MKRAPDSTRASDLILQGRYAQAAHATANLHRKLFDLLVGSLDDGSPFHQILHFADGRRHRKVERESLARDVRSIEALYELLSKTINYG